MIRLRAALFVASAATALFLSSCASEPKPKGPSIDRDELATAMKEQFAMMVEEIERARDRLSINDNEVVVVPVDRLENDTGDYYPEARLRMLADLFIDQISDQERQANRSQLAVVPYDSRQFYRLMQTEGIQQIEDCVRPDNMDKIQEAMKRTKKVAHGYARLKLQKGLGDREFFVRIEFVPLNGESPIRTKGSNLPPA